MRGIAVDQAGNVYLTSRANSSVGVTDDVVVKFSPAGAVLARFAPAPGKPGATDNSLRGTAVDADGSIWVLTDRLEKPLLVHLDATGNRLTAPDLSVVLPTRGTGQTYGIATRGGRLYVSGEMGDTARAGLAMAVLTPAGRLVDMIAGAGDQVAVSDTDAYVSGLRLAGSPQQAPEQRDRAAIGDLKGAPIEPPNGSRFTAFAITDDCAGAVVRGAGSDSGGPYVTEDVEEVSLSTEAAASCKLTVGNTGSPCANDQEGTPIASYMGGEPGGRITYKRLTATRQPDNPDVWVYVEFDRGQVHQGPVVLAWACLTQGSNSPTFRYEYKGSVTLTDPSGTVVGARSRRPLAGAGVSLRLSPTRNGRFAAPPLNAISPQFQVELTDRTGKFGWNVAEGYWRVVARAFGYRTLRTAAFHVPPEVTGLRLALRLDPAQQARLIDPAGHVGSVRLGAHRAGRAPAGLRLGVARGRVRSIQVRSRRFQTALGIRLGSRMSALEAAYPAAIKPAALKRRGAIRIRVRRATFTVRRGRVSAITLR